MDEPTWREDLPRLVRGSLGRQQRGHWNTTVANAWGVLAMEKFSATFEAEPVTGSTRARLGGQAKAIDWSKSEKGGSLEFEWPREPLGTASSSTTAAASPGSRCRAARRFRSRARSRAATGSRRASRASKRAAERLSARRRAARPARSRGAERHDLGRGRRSDSGGRIDSRHRPRRGFADADRAARSGRAGSGRPSRSARSTPSAPTTAWCRRGSGPWSTPCGSTIPAASRCRRRGSRPCTAPEMFGESPNASLTVAP